MPNFPHGFRNSFNGKDAQDKKTILKASQGPTTCTKCAAPALYRVGKNGYCRTHREEARSAGTRERMSHDYLGGVCERKQKRLDEREKKRPALSGMRKTI